MDGYTLGYTDGRLVGFIMGYTVGTTVGNIVIGLTVGTPVGAAVIEVNTGHAVIFDIANHMKQNQTTVINKMCISLYTTLSLCRRNQIMHN